MTHPDAIKNAEHCLRNPIGIDRNSCLVYLADLEQLVQLAKDANKCGVYEDALHKVNQWADAYPVDIFKPVNLKAARKALEDAGIDMGALHAEWARHIVESVGNIARQALTPANR